VVDYRLECPAEPSRKPSALWLEAFREVQSINQSITFAEQLISFLRAWPWSTNLEGETKRSVVHSDDDDEDSAFLLAFLIEEEEERNVMLANKFFFGNPS